MAGPAGSTGETSSRKHGPSSRTLIAAIALIAMLIIVAPAAAATITVDTTDDSGSGTLRSAIDDANATPDADRIVFTPGLNQTLALESPLPTITTPLSIQGPGASKLTLSGGGTSGILNIALPKIGEVEVADVSMRGGSAADGGAISSFGTDLILDHSVVSGNQASNTGGALSVSEGSLTMRDSRLRGNSAKYAGGAVHLYNAGMTISHSEISSSTAGGSGGGIGVANPIGPLAIERSRVMGNKAAGTGGGVSVTGGPTQPLTIARSELSRNEVTGDGGGVSTVGSLQPVMIGVNIENNHSTGRGPDVYPPMLDRAAKLPAAKPAATSKPASASKPTAKKASSGALPPASAGSLPPASSLSEDLDSAPASSTLLGGVAFAPPEAPTRVKAVIDAANFISRTPYVYGGGHASFYSSGYDCSGAVSFALFGGGFLNSPLASGGFETWGEPGPGKWITVYANPGHAYAVIADRRWDTVGDAKGTGPRWHLDTASPAGFVARHPAGY